MRCCILLFSWWFTMTTAAGNTHAVGPFSVAADCERTRARVDAGGGYAGPCEAR
jgi:hypothetical protein